MKYFEITKKLVEILREYKKHSLTETNIKQIIRWTEEILRS